MTLLTPFKPHPVTGTCAVMAHQFLNTVSSVAKTLGPSIEYNYGLRSDLRAPNFKNFSGGACPQTPPSMCMLMHTPSSVPPQS